MLNDIALDRYTFIRDAYLQRRRNLIYDGDPPDEERGDESAAPPEAAPPAAAVPGVAASAAARPGL